MQSLKDHYYGISEQKSAFKDRYEDALALKESERWRGAVYLAGYHIECLLKWKLMTNFGCPHLDELERRLRDRKLLKEKESVYTHDLQKLLRLSSENGRLSQDADCWKAFNIVNRWTSEWRYTADKSNERDAIAFFEAVEQVSHWILKNT